MVKSGRLPTMWSITRRPGSGLKSGRPIATIALLVIFVFHSLGDDQSLNSTGRCNTMSPATGNGSVSAIKLKLCQKMMTVKNFYYEELFDTSCIHSKCVSEQLHQHDQTEALSKDDDCNFYITKHFWMYPTPPRNVSHSWTNPQIRCNFADVLVDEQNLMEVCIKPKRKSCNMGNWKHPVNLPATKGFN